MELDYDKDILELIARPMKSDLNCLLSISGHKQLKADLVIFKVILRKWFNRFHTSQISRRFSLINSRINQFVSLDVSNNFANKLGSLINEKYSTRSGKLEYPTYDQVAWVMKCSIRACEILCKIIRDIISVFEDCTLWIKLGHFARQMRIITAAVSRLSIFAKTIVMKICDVYPYLFNYLEIVDYIRLEEDQLSKDIFHFLRLINVDPPRKQEVKSSAKVKFKSMYKRNEDVGEKISRNLFNEKIKNKVNGSTNLPTDSVESSLPSKISNKSKNFDARDQQNGSLNFESMVNDKIDESSSLESNEKSFCESSKSQSVYGVDNDVRLKFGSRRSDSNGFSDLKGEAHDTDFASLAIRKKKLKNSVNKNETRMLTQKLKQKQLFARAKRRQKIRSSMQFEVENKE